MSLLFLAIALLFGWLAFNLYHPIQGRGGLDIISFLSGWLTGELAIHHIAWQVAVVALFIWGGAVVGIAGAAGFIICVGAWLAMGHFYLSGHRACREIRSALRAALGDDHEARMIDNVRNRLALEPDYRRILKPWGNVDPAVEVIKDIPQGSHGLALDIYRPRQPVQGAPVLMQIHGGAWTEKMGNKERQAIPLMNHMALRGWIAVAISYRLSPRATFPDHLIDCKEALVWIKNHIAGYGGNPDFIVVTGGSAGGHLCALMALTQNDRAFQPGFEHQDTSVAGAIPFYGVYDFANKYELPALSGRRAFLETSIMKKNFDDDPDSFERASPLYRIHADAPPFLIIHGACDSLVPVEEARIFSKELAAVSEQPVVYAEISGAQHAFDMFPSIRSEHVKHGVERFLGWLYSRYLEDADVPLRTRKPTAPGT